MSPYEIAKLELLKDIKEFPGGKHNPEIVKYTFAVKDSGNRSDEESWCAKFVGWCILESAKTGFKSHPATYKSNAKSYLEWGLKADKVREGDIVVFWRNDPKGWEGHVGFFVKFDDRGDVMCLGGNQQNKVCIATYPKYRVLAYRTV